MKALKLLFAFLFIFTTNLLFSQVERIEKGNLVIEDIPEIPTRIIERMLQYQNTRSATIQDWFPDGNKMLISTRFGETSQLHVLEKAGGARKQITFFKEPLRGASMCPDINKNGFLFTKDIGGNEYYQVFYYDLEKGNYEMLTDGSSRNESVSWSNNGDKFIYSSTKRNGRDYDILLSDINNPKEAQPILEKSGYWGAVDWSTDDKKLLVKNYISANESYYHILNIESGKLEQINPKDEKIAYGSAAWSKDNKGIYITTDDGSNFLQLKYYDLKKKKFKTLSSEIPWNIEQFELSKDGKKLAFIANESGLAKLYILNTKTNKYKKAPNIPIGQVYGLYFHPSSGKLALVINTPQTPGDIFVLNLESELFDRWTYSEVGGLQTDLFVVPELRYFETFDKVNGEPRQIPVFYYKPKDVEGPIPVLYIHSWRS